jgi:hypothetical protein
VNPLKTMAVQQEHVAVYNSTNELLKPPKKMKVVEVCDDELVENYVKNSNNVENVLYLCSNLTIFGTEYKVGEFVILPNSTNISPSFGKIKKLLCSQKNGYLMYQKTISVYCEKSDLFMISELSEDEIIPVEHLADYHPLEGSALS